MILIAFLGSRLDSQARKLLRHKQMRMSVGEGKIRDRAGTTPPLAATRRRTRWSFPPFGLYRSEHGRIETRSVRYPELIGFGYAQGRLEIWMNKFKIEKGVSRINRVKLQATIEESIAADLGLLGEWSNNDKNYIVNELLRFALSQDREFQAYKESIGL
jgi:hypothetical protein